MKRKKQQILTVILSILMLISLMPGSFLPVMAASDNRETSDTAGAALDSCESGDTAGTAETTTLERTVSYSPAKQVVDASTGLTKSSYRYTQEGTNSILYYGGDVTVTFRVEEENFFAEDVSIEVNGKEEKPDDWIRKGDVWISHLTLSGDGDYSVAMNYTDCAGHKMRSYTSEKIVIDTKPPVIEVTYENSDVKGMEGKRAYFDRAQTAVIRVTEDNFRADDVAAAVTAVDVTGEKVDVSDYAAYLSNRSNWTREGDGYTARISFPVDANYSFDISCRDLARNESANYTPDLFTVDQTEPENLTISYNEDLKTQQVGAALFRYYNDMVTVTISGEDATSGIDHFTYTLSQSASSGSQHPVDAGSEPTEAERRPGACITGSSERDTLSQSGTGAGNEQLSETVIGNAEVVQDGTHFTARFSIPHSVLQANNQFNGTVDFAAYDYASNQSGLNDNNRIVVDNLAPTATVTYNNPVQESGGVAYYAGDIDAVIEIREANFYSEDVQVSVEKDGQSYEANVIWTDNSADVHTGTLRLREDGDYLVTVNYTDRSGNRMEPYTSGQLTVDTEHPTISVSGVQANSANKQDPYGFIITVSDNEDNLPEDYITPVLTAIMCDEDGNCFSREVELPVPEMTENNQSYRIRVENLENDGIYTLSCRAKDLANQECSRMTLDDGQEYESVIFSVNRNGSSFRIDGASKELRDQYYVYQVKQDVVIEEINADLIENYVVKMNGTVLNEGTDYTTDTLTGENTWSVRTYSVDSALFKEEGEYNLAVESVDKTETASYSDAKNLKIGFVVDRTAPVVAFAGLENGGRYEAGEQNVTAVPSDDGGKLKAFCAVLRDKTRESEETLIELSGEKLDTYLAEHDGQINFAIPEGANQQVTVTCMDCAVKEDGTTNMYQETFDHITVSADKAVVFCENKTLFCGGMIVCGTAMAGILTFAVWMKKKKAAVEAETE